MGGYAMGHPAIEVYALLKSDVSVYDPVIQGALDFLNGLKPSKTYCTAIYLMALDAALSQIELDLAIGRGDFERKVRASGPQADAWLKRMNECTQWLLQARRKADTTWDYAGASGRFDNSNTQFAILALGVAAKRGLKVPMEIWEGIAEHFLSSQQKDGPKVDPGVTFNHGDDASKAKTKVSEKNFREEQPPEVKARGWGYVEPKDPTLTMTSAGLSSLILAREYLFRSERFPVAQRQRLNQAIWDAAAWLGVNQLSFGGWLYYALYSVEKVGDLGMMEKIGGIDWYRKGVDILLQSQQPNGSWAQSADHDANGRYQTSFALLFLNRATDLMSHARPLILSGKGSGSGKDRPGWVYVERFKGEVSITRLFRKLKFNPQQSALRLCEDVVRDATKAARPHELIPYLIDLASSPFKAVGDLARKSLVTITGEQHEDLNQYRAWSDTWQFVTKAAREKDRGALPRLRELMKSTNSRALKMQIMWAYERLQSLEVAGDLFAAMESDDAELRLRAYGALKFITNERLPFDANGSPSKRADQIAAWRSLVASKGK
jgi:hypothetical protein